MRAILYALGALGGLYALNLMLLTIALRQGWARVAHRVESIDFILQTLVLGGLLAWALMMALGYRG